MRRGRAAAEGGVPGEREAQRKGERRGGRAWCVARGGRRAPGAGRRAGGGRAGCGPGGEGGGGLRRHTPPLAGGLSACEEPPPPPPPLGVALSPRFPRAGSHGSRLGARPRDPLGAAQRPGPAPRLSPSDPASLCAPGRAASQPEVRSARAGARWAGGALGCPGPAPWPSRVPRR